MSFEKRVQIALVKKGKSAAWLARQMGVSRVYVGDLLKGRRQTPERINQIEEILKDVLEDE